MQYLKFVSDENMNQYFDYKNGVEQDSITNSQANELHKCEFEQRSHALGVKTTKQHHSNILALGQSSLCLKFLIIFSSQNVVIVVGNVS